MHHHLTIRVAWHDQKWNGTICRAPKRNAYCLALDRIREERDDDAEERLAGKRWDELSPEEMPPCLAEGAGFMTPHGWRRVFRHPYTENRKAAATHGVLKPTAVPVPEFSTFAVPFWWLLRENQKEIESGTTEALPTDEDAPFPTPWVFGSSRQEALLEQMFGRVTDDVSLVFFYCKEGHPLGDRFPRLVVGAGRVLKRGKLLRYESSSDDTYPLWDRLITHSIRPDGVDGFLLPYHDYTASTGDPIEDERRLRLLEEIAVDVEATHTRAFSYAAELAKPDAALSVLVRCLEAVRRIREHKIVDGPWSEREDWLNAQIAATWKDRGAFPGFGSALEALGLRLGTALSHELLSSGAVKPEDDPWPIVGEILSGHRNPPQRAYEADLDATRATWKSLSAQRRNLLMLLSRFALTPKQARRWFERSERGAALATMVEDPEILANPYRIAETDLGDGREPPIAVGTIDRGLLPTEVIASRHPVPAPSVVESGNDARRIRAAFVAVLREAAQGGDSLLSVSETMQRASKVGLSQPFAVGTDWVAANAESMASVVDQVSVLVRPENDERVASLQLTEFRHREDRLRALIEARCSKTLPSLGAEWSELVVEAISEAGHKFDLNNRRHADALAEQAEALEKITTRKLSVLVGRAGTGKSSALGGLLRCKALAERGILLLAPTGKARVRLGRATGAEAKTIAQFLYECDRYDGVRQRPLFTGTKKYKKESTVVIDECSMLTMNDLAAILEALDLIQVERLILVGDPNQLPPIGVGRPFADTVAVLDRDADAAESAVAVRGGAIGRLSVEVRTVTGGRSDALRLASWYTREPQPVDADRVLGDLSVGRAFNDLEVCYWSTPDDLRKRLLEQLAKHLKIRPPDEIAAFNREIGLDERGFVPGFNAEGAESFQILSPVRMHAHGVHELNRWVQRRFRADELARSREPWGFSLGDEEIVIHDKVINVRNAYRDSYCHEDKATSRVYIANGEIGLVSRAKRPFLNIAFSGREGQTVGYHKREFGKSGGPPVELAYALTVHKAQGSEFRHVFVILPKNCFVLSRELIYTALTRARQQLVLLIEGADASALVDLSRPERSETARRNTNLFFGAVREHFEALPYAEHLIHRTLNGHMVRSKSELAIANILFAENIEYEYEREFRGAADPYPLRPDFTFADPAGSPIIWEHLGMLSRDDYREGWEWKKAWYERNGFTLGVNLFTTEDDGRGGLDSKAVLAVAQQIKRLI